MKSDTWRIGGINKEPANAVFPATDADVIEEREARSVMTQQNTEKGTEWIFCRNIKGKCSGLNPKTKVLEKIPKSIIVHGKTVHGWQVKIESEKSEGHIKLNLSNLSDE